MPWVPAHGSGHVNVTLLVWASLSTKFEKSTVLPLHE